ncbi:MAG: hypothetical protein AAFU73_02775 [Planctomycetota bacterium]
MTAGTGVTCARLARRAALPFTLALLGGCAARLPEPAPPIGPSPSSRMLDAWSAARVPGFERDEAAQAEALAAALEARAGAPGWPAPERFVDDWRHRPWLTLPERYGEHLERARAGEADAAYLAGRLGGTAADARLGAARAQEPRLSWAHHGLAWRTFASGAPHRAVRGGQAAYTLARDPSERAQFAIALARYLDGAEERAPAENLLRLTLAADDALALRGPERALVEAELARVELESLDPADVRRGAARALRLLGTVSLDVQERLRLLLGVRGSATALVSRAEVELALLDARAAARTASEEESIERALELLDGGTTREGASGSAWRDRWVEAAGAGTLDVELTAWCQVLPDRLVAEDGLPRRAALRALVLAARTDADGTAGELGEALLAAGWFAEARALSASLGSDTLERRAAEGEAALAAVRALARRVDAQEAFVNSGAVDASGASSRERGRVDSLRELEDEVARLTARVGGTPARSPLIRYGPLGEVIHPGPRFSAEDDRLGRGAEGEPVPGLAALFDALGRFALVGRGVGQGGPDATILRLVGVEEREGEHLGRPFSGTVFWCQGADVPGRYARRGAAISGAALHEGYYVDLGVVERDRAHWEDLAGRFSARAGAVEAALGVRGARVPPELRTESTPALGAADRMRLAVMRGADGALRVPGLDALGAVVAVHEEGHLCDRKQWYPLSLGRALRLVSFAGAHGFSSNAIAEALEARAQLVALCCADDVRLAWIDLLDAAEAESSGGITPHGSAYRSLLASILRRMDGELRFGAWDDAGVDPERRLIDQLHRIEPELLRELAVREARSRGLARL